MIPPSASKTCFEMHIAIHERLHLIGEMLDVRLQPLPLHCTLVLTSKSDYLLLFA